MTDDTKNDQALEDLFQSARDDVPDLAPDFMARLISDADAAIEDQTAPSPRPPVEPGFWSKLITGLVPASGLAAATLTGVWIGFQIPSTGFSDGLTFTDSTDFDVSAFLPAAALGGFGDLESDG